ncbi:hypothetical protein PLICRDRAFT_44349 [Plicaturopsis crispa FD-325 SS-3]|nr:hypothetical protein PLICRDRAFT_44349 [Plicaturopsis crispa FD-325 SS-3]
MNATCSGTPVTAAAQGAPKDLSSLISMLFSLGGVVDWLKLIVLGGALETCRRFAFKLWDYFLSSFFVTAHFEQEDMSFVWMMHWLSKQPSWKKAREVQVSTATFGVSSTGSIDIDDDDDDDYADPNSMTGNGRRLSYLPTVSSTYTLLYKGRWMRVQRARVNNGWYTSTEETLEISIMTRDRQFLDDLLLKAKKEYEEVTKNTISVFSATNNNRWRHMATRPKRPLNSIVLDPGIKNLLVDDAKDFFQSKNWYADRGIPFRRGYLLHGAPGSGKTSLIQGIAGELGLSVYMISLSRLGLDDSGLNDLISDLPGRCIALMEDIDAAFHHGLTRESDKPSSPTPPPSGDASASTSTSAPPPPAPAAAEPASTSRITLSGLLNALDGIGAQEGRILFATTNKYSSLDPALRRPGRMDLHIEFKLASKFQAQELFKRFYLPSAHDLEEEKALESEKPLVDLDPVDEKPSSPADSDSYSASYTGQSHSGRMPKLSHDQIIALSERFAETIPEREVSMASLQGYLMIYKIRPVEAVEEAAAWVEQERQERLTGSKSAR